MNRPYEGSGWYTSYDSSNPNYDSTSVWLGFRARGGTSQNTRIVPSLVCECPLSSLVKLEDGTRDPTTTRQKRESRHFGVSQTWRQFELLYKFKWKQNNFFFRDVWRLFIHILREDLYIRPIKIHHILWRLLVQILVVTTVQLSNMELRYTVLTVKWRHQKESFWVLRSVWYFLRVWYLFGFNFV